jgi:hypothetical protein
MNRHLPRTFVISIVSFVLLYYSTVWAVLRCFHEEGHSDHSVALADNNAHGNNAYLRFPSHRETHIDCLNLAYHTESLAGPSSSPQLQRWATQTDFRVADFLISLTATEDWTQNLWLRAVFESPAGFTFFFGAPRYLLLSIFRI